MLYSGDMYIECGGIRAFFAAHVACEYIIFAMVSHMDGMDYVRLIRDDTMFAFIHFDWWSAAIFAIEHFHGWCS